MNVVAWISLIGTFLFYAGMVYVNYPEPHKTGEKAILSALGMVFHSLGYFISLTALVIALNSLGRFEWICKSAGIRFVLLFIAVVAISSGFFFAAVLRNERWDKVPSLVLQIARFHGMIWIPLITGLAGLLLLMSVEKANPNQMVGKILASISLGFGLLISCSLLIAWTRESLEKQARIISAARANDAEYYQNSMAKIDSFEDGQSLVEILPFAGRYQDEDIRKRALEKIRARSNWEQELLKILQSETGNRDAYLFLECNRVSDRKRFAEAMDGSLRRMAPAIKQEVQDTNNMQDWSFEWYRIESALEAIDFQFTGTGLDFVPAIEGIRSALDDHRPERFNKVQVKASVAVRKWLKKHSSY